MKTKILIEEEVSCEGSDNWRESCQAEVSCYFFGGENCGPGGGGHIRFSCSDPEHKKNVARNYKSAYEKPVKLARLYKGE